ncbi:MAG: potassium channel family protein [Planctomycetota bacterium]|nr:potassium channel family protein [Planctomycetota bacterium]
MAQSSYDPIRWLVGGAIALVGITVISTFVYWGLGHYYDRPDWTFNKCLFMVVITLSTIGYGDILELEHGPAVALYFTMVLAMVGVGVPAFVLSNILALIVEGLFSDILRRRRMEKRMAKLAGHIIVCGAGITGLHAIDELLKTKRPFVAIDRDPEALARATEELGEFLYLADDADNDDTLKKAGIDRASGLIACLSDDKENLFLVLSARRLNPKLRIVSKVVDVFAAAKLRAAGADRVINPTEIGGMRLVSELVRPTAVGFLDRMLRDRAGDYRFEELTVQAGSAMENLTLATSGLHKEGILVVAALPQGQEHLSYNPTAEFKLDLGCTIVVLGPSENLGALRQRFLSPGAGEAPA